MGATVGEEVGAELGDCVGAKDGIIVGPCVGVNVNVGVEDDARLATTSGWNSVPALAKPSGQKSA